MFQRRVLGTAILSLLFLSLMFGDALLSPPMLSAQASNSRSSEVIDAYEISKNPYKLKGRSGILDTANVTLTREMGGRHIKTPYPGGCLRFDKMIGEHTALFEVMVGGDDGVESDGEIAVDLPNSDPPTVNKLWRITVEGVENVINGYGSHIQITRIRFNGYFVPPTKLSEYLKGTQSPVTVRKSETEGQQVISKIISDGSTASAEAARAEVLSDTQGVDFDPYIRQALAEIRRNWKPLIPEESRPPLSKQGEALIRITILPDGSIAEMHLDGSTHDDAINHLCWSAITSEGRFPALPSLFHGPNLELRIHFSINK